MSDPTYPWAITMSLAHSRTLQDELRVMQFDFFSQISRRVIARVDVTMETNTEPSHHLPRVGGAERIVLVSEYDVVLGRASGTQGQQGNFRYRALCHTAATWYHAARGNANLKRAIVNKVIKDLEPGRFLKRQADGSFVIVDGKERYTKVQTDLRTGRIGRMMNKKLEIPKEQIDAAVEALAKPNMAMSQPIPIDRSVHAARPSTASTVTRTVSSGDDQPMPTPLTSPHDAVLAKMKLEAEYLELAKEKEVLVMRNKILELKQDLKGLREYNRQLEDGNAVPHMSGEAEEHELAVYNGA